MRKLVFAFTLISIGICADCQTYFNKFLEPVGELNPNIVDLLVNSDGLLIQTLHTENKSIISVTDRKGVLDKHVTFNGFGTSYLGLEKINEEFVMWGEDKSNPTGLLLKFINDDLIETSTVGLLTEGDWDFPVSFIVNQDNIYSLCVYVDSTTNLVHGIVKGIDSDGEEIWENDIHDGENFVNIYQIGVNQNEEIVVSSRFDDGPNDVVGVITYLNQSGTIRRQRKMSEEIEPGTRVTFVELSNGDIICGTVVDRLFDWEFQQNEWYEAPTKYYWLREDNLQEIKDTIYTSPRLESPGGEKLWKGNGDYFFIYGNVWYVEEDQTYGMLKKVDNDGNILWSRRYQHEDFTGSKNFHGIEHIQEIPDGSIYTAGSAKFSPGRNHIWIMHLDENGCLGDNCGEVVITDLEEEILSKGKLTLYPNPATDVLTIDELDRSKSYDYKITDVSGIIYQQGVINKSTSDSIDISFLNAGLYFIVMSKDGITDFVKYQFVVH